MMSYNQAFPDCVVSYYAEKLSLISEALKLLDQARTKLTVYEDGGLKRFAEQIEDIRIEILKTIAKELYKKLVERNENRI